MLRRPLLAVAVVVLLGLATGAALGRSGAPDDAASPAPTAAPTAAPSAPASAAPAPEASATPAVDPASVAANELGQVPVIMYHRLLPDGGGEYDRTPEEFRAELGRLYDMGFRPVTLRDLVAGDLDLPAGTSPVVLTFDDSTVEQVSYTETGEIAPDSAIGILLAFAAEHPGFDPVATLFVNEAPFAQSDPTEVLRDLHERGFELGNHTATHANLSALDPAGVRRELAAGAAVITAAVPEAEVTSLSLPLGIWPEPRELAYAGEFEGQRYAHEAIVLVGAGPAPSPFAAEFDPLAIPRIRSAPWDGGEPNYGSGFWLDWFASHPDRRYVSDGDPDTVAYPAAAAAEIAPAHADRALPY